MALPTATERVFTTIELLENILLHLPMKDLLFAQAICGNWKAVIDSSPILQKALFFRPATNELAFYHEPSYDEDDEDLYDLEFSEFFYLCPADRVHLVRDFEQYKLAHDLYDLFPESDGHASPSVREAIEQLKTQLNCEITKTRVFLNPLLVNNFRWFVAKFVDPGSQEVVPRSCIKRDGDLSDAAKCPNASWRRMLITQPPLGAVASAFSGPGPGQEPPNYWDLLKTKHLGQPVTAEALRNAMGAWDHGGFDVLGLEKCEEVDSWTDGTSLDKIGIGVPHDEKHNDSDDEASDASDSDETAGERDSLYSEDGSSDNEEDPVDSEEDSSSSDDDESEDGALERELLMLGGE